MKRTPSPRASIVLACMVAASPCVAQDTATTVRLQSRNVPITEESTAAFLDSLGRIAFPLLHGLAHFTQPLSVTDRDRLAARGVALLAPLRGNVYRVEVSREVDTADSLVAALLGGLALLTPEDKIPPAIRQGEVERFTRVTPAGDTTNYVVNADGTLSLLVQFYRSTPEAQITELLRARAVRFAHVSGTSWHVTIRPDELVALAADDRVRWIDVVTPMGPDNDLARVLLGVTSLQTTEPTGWVTGLTGAGTQVAVFDGGIDESHPTFRLLDPAGAVLGSRVVGPRPERDWHGTHIAGTIAGNGSNSSGVDSWGLANGGASAFQWAGIAPAAELVDEGFLTATLGMNAIRTHVQVHGMDLSNHSYWMTLDGYYNSNHQLHDAIITGEDPAGGPAGPRRLHVHSAGNWGLPKEGTPQHGYFALGNHLKNAVVVGSYDDATGAPSTFSSLGPTSDGRLKPDVLAPGANIKSSGFCSGFNADYCPFTPNPPATWPRRNFYVSYNGTSTAAANASGVLALALQVYGEAFSVDLDAAPPLPATLRALAIHGSRDLSSNGMPWFVNQDGLAGAMPVLGFPGPDFASGYGLLDARSIERTIRARRIIEGEIDATCSVQTFRTYVPGGVDFTLFSLLPEYWWILYLPLKVTLAWDDPVMDAAVAFGEPQLVNDLDLALIDPLGRRHYPYRPGHTIRDPATNAELADAQQTCGSAIAIERDLAATPDPAYYGPGHPANQNDPILPDQLHAAERGKDHVNNVEQVLAWGPPGLWHVEVSGFDVQWGPQPFSLVGLLQLPFISIAIPRICRLAPGLCRIVVEPLCERYRRLCDSAPILELPPGRVRATLRSLDDRLIIPVAAGCAVWKIADVCTAADDRSGYEVRIASLPVGVAVALYDRFGRTLPAQALTRTSALFRVTRDRGDVFLVLTPNPGGPERQPIDIELAIAALRPPQH